MEIPSPFTMDFLILSRSFMRAITLRSLDVISEFFQKDIHFLLSAGTFFTDNDRIFHKILKGDCMILHFQIMLGYRGCNDKFILTERKKDTALIAGILSNQRQVHSAVKDAVDGLCTICLNRVKISIWGCVFP